MTETLETWNLSEDSRDVITYLRDELWTLRTDISTPIEMAALALLVHNLDIILDQGAPYAELHLSLNDFRLVEDRTAGIEIVIELSEYEISLSTGIIDFDFVYNERVGRLNHDDTGGLSHGDVFDWWGWRSEFYGPLNLSIRYCSASVNLC